MSVMSRFNIIFLSFLHVIHTFLKSLPFKALAINILALILCLCPTQLGRLPSELEVYISGSESPYNVNEEDVSNSVKKTTTTYLY